MTPDAALVAIRDVAEVTVSYVDKKTKPGETPVLLCNYRDVYYNRFIHSEMEFMEATATAREITRSTLTAGDVIITKDSEEQYDIGVPALVQEDIPNLVCGYHLAILRPHAERLDSRYLLYALQRNETQQQFHSIARGLTRFGLRKDEMASVAIPLPPLAEQRRIVAALEARMEAAGRARRAAEAQLAAVLALPAALLREVFHGAPDARSRARVWRSVPLGNFMPRRTGTLDPSKFPGTRFVLYSIPAFERGIPDFIPAEEIGSAKQVVESNDVLISRIFPHLRRVWVVSGEHTEKTIASTEWIVLRSGDMADVIPGYMRAFLMTDEFHRQFMDTVAGVGGSLMRARASLVREIEIQLPPLDEQRRIVAGLEAGMAAAERAQRAAEAQLAAAEALPSAILRRAFAGEAA